MEKAKRRVRLCLVVVVFLAAVLGIFYYYNELNENDMRGEGTLVAAMHTDWRQLCQ